jgi:HD-like signal output (HDOD) protein
MSTAVTSQAQDGNDVGDGRVVKAATELGLLGGGAHAVSRILVKLSDPLLAASDIAAILADYPRMRERVLGIATSSYYGVRAVANIDRGIVLLGLDAVRGLVASACLSKSLPRGGGPSRLDLGALLHHSLATAFAAEIVARRRRPALARDAFFAGLLHDLGVALQVRIDPRGVEALCAALDDDPTLDPRKEERSRVRVTHEFCVADLFEVWRLPPALVAAVNHHHHPARAPEKHRELVSVVHVGDWIGKSGMPERGFGFGRVPLDGAALSLLGLTEPVLMDIAAELKPHIESLHQALL